jgi:hypothetical protein
MKQRQFILVNLLSQNKQPLTAPKKNAGGGISFLPTSCRFAKVCYFYVGKKEYSISATNKHCVGRKHFGFKAALLLAPKRYGQA